MVRLGKSEEDRIFFSDLQRLHNIFDIMLAAVHPAQILSYNKMLGQIQDAGNTATLAHYLKLLESALLISGLELFRGGIRQKRDSSPKLIIWNNGIINALRGDFLKDSRNDFSWWGRLIENAVGAYLLHHLGDMPYAVYYGGTKGWRLILSLRPPSRYGGWR